MTTPTKAGSDVEAIIRSEVGDACYDDVRWLSTREIVERCVAAALATSPIPGDTGADHIADAGKVIVDTGARERARPDRERVADLIDPAATLPQWQQYNRGMWIGRRNDALRKADAILALSPAALPSSREGEWMPIETASCDVPLLVGCWVEEDNAPARWSAWTAYPGEGLGCDGTWGDPPTHAMPLPAPPAAIAPISRETGE